MKQCFLRFWANFYQKTSHVGLKICTWCGFRNNMTRFQKHKICFQHSQCVVSKRHGGLYVEPKLHGYVDSVFRTKVSTCLGSFGGFKTTCFQLDRTGSFETTGISYFSCDRSCLLGWIITCSFYCPRLWERDLIVWLSGDRFSFHWIALPPDTISSSRNRQFLNFDVLEAEE